MPDSTMTNDTMRQTPSPADRALRAQPRRLLAILALTCVLGLAAGCLYRMPVQQGNFLDPTQVVQLKEQVKQVAKFESRKKVLEDKNRIIDELEKSRVGPVKVLDHVSQSLEPLKVWLVRVAVNGKEIDLEGRAATNDDVVEFVNNLRRTDYFSNINLQESRAAVESQLNIYQFKLGFRLKG